VTASDENNSARKAARRRMALEALVLFVFAWIASIVASVIRPSPAGANFGVAQFLVSTFVTGLECFVFGYVLSRFFKQFKTGCAIVIILFLAYLIWVGRNPR
jgi:galactitol-specific phosphotransferase system IIC component